jgi:2-keto-4-pentenoate hydratase/2-oxohepta-3-ene-1,7-dioic acid hydratase in catechol pathway
MGWQIIRYVQQNARHAVQWGVVRGDVVMPVPGAYATLAEFLTEGGAEQVRAFGQDGERGEAIPLASIEPLSPVTAPCHIICQGTNYQAHRRETQTHPGFNLLFAKADSSLTSPRGPVVRPRGVQLLDYELELGLVLGRAITGSIQPRADQLEEVVAGLVMANDVSARDVQIPEEQWFRGKSFRTFCPVGPYFYMFDRGDVQMLGTLHLRLWVNGQLRQDAAADQLIYGPAATLTLLSETIDLAPGDLLLTGTPGGVALRPPTGMARRLGSLLSPARRMRAFVTSQRKRAEYLHDGDIVTSTIATPDGAIDLGRQEWQVTSTAAASLNGEQRRALGERAAVSGGD